MSAKRYADAAPMGGTAKIIDGKTHKMKAKGETNSRPWYLAACGLLALEGRWELVNEEDVEEEKRCSTCWVDPKH